MVGGCECGGARGGRGYGGARGCACAPRPEPRLAREESARAFASAVPSLSGCCGIEPRPGRSAPRGRRICSGDPRVFKRSEGRETGSAEPGASRGPGGSNLRRARGRRLSRAYTRRPRSRSPVAPVTPLPAVGAALGFPGLDPHSPRPQLWSSGVDPRPGAGETLGSEQLQKQDADEASGGGGVWTHLLGMETPPLLLSRCKGN